jgi:polyphosphate kinase
MTSTAALTLINRELSLLEFNQRVLAQAQDPAVPLLERLRFLCISSSNLDEFFEIRVAGIKQLHENSPGSLSPDGLTPREQLAAIHERAQELVAEQYECLSKHLLPALRAAGIRLMPRSSWDDATREWLERYFENEVEPVLTPLALDPSRPFPRIQNKSLNFVVSLEGEDAYGREATRAIVQAPRSLPRRRTKISSALRDHRSLHAAPLRRYANSRRAPIPRHAQQRSLR